MAKKISSNTIGNISLLSAGIAAALFCSSASAQLVQNITIGNPKALALGNAVTADPPGVDSIHFNPAGLAKIKGRQQQLKLLVAHITYDAEFGDQNIPDDINQAYVDISGDPAYPDDPVANTSSSTSDPVLMLPGSGLTPTPFLAVPFGGIAIEDPNYGWTFATSVYSPQAIGYERAENDPGAFQGQQVGISRITYFAPSVGFNFNDELMLGASIGFSWQGLGIKTKFRAPETTIAFLDQLGNELDEADLELLESIGPYDTVGTLELEMEDALSLSFNIGVLWEPTEWISFGFVYQSEAKADLEGDFTMTYEDAWLAMTDGLSHPPLSFAIPILNDGESLNVDRRESGDISLEYIVPAHLAFGTSIKVLPDLKVNFDIKWTDYEAWDSLDFEFSQPVDFLSVSNIVYKFGPALGDGDNADPNIMRIKRAYESIWSWAIGFEYQWNDNMVIRAGYEPRESAVPDDRVDLLAPIAYADLYTFGIGLQLDAYTKIDAAFGYLHSEFDAEAGESQNLNSTLPGRVVYNPYAFLDVKAETNAYILAFSYDTKF
ncbi:MAG: outer membrane protein transport protein [Pseudomonadales bacterium]|nr:outer membrane protein transport protein [Pseudomonadales bacterium]